MTTKEQERAALAKVESILATLDGDGWVNTAFAGCVDDARENIESDFALSWKDRAENYRNGMMIAQCERDDARRALKEAHDAMTTAHDEYVSLSRQYENLCRVKAETENTAADESARADAAEKEAARLLDENLRLKARLYDLLCK